MSIWIVEEHETCGYSCKTLHSVHLTETEAARAVSDSLDYLTYREVEVT